ncbi:MAG: hypothetical protein Kapaf2KO_06100 [Candidatus Kapaibacteriales bacterium]
MTKYLLYTAVLFVLCSSAAIAQMDNPLMPEQKSEKLLIGPVAGINLVNHSTDYQVVAEQNAGADNPDITGACPSFESGSSTGFFVGFTTEYLIGGSKNSTMGIIGRVMYQNFPASFETASPPYPVKARSAATGETITEISRVTNTLDITYDVITIEAQYKYNFLDGLGIVAGPSFDFTLNAGEEKQMILENEDLVFAEWTPEAQAAGEFIDERTRNLNPGNEIEGSAAFRLGIKAGIQYEWILPNSGYMIIPHINYNFGVTQFTTEQDWNVSALQIGLDFRFGV